MIDLKTIFGFVAIILTIVGYFPYIRDVIKGKTEPHVYSWFLFGFITFIAFALQVQGGAGAGSLATFVSTLLIFTVYFLSLKHRRHQDVTTLDKLFFGLTLLALVLWLIAKQPIISAIMITITNLLAYGPTIRKAWWRPHTETLLFFMINMLRFALIIASLQTYSILTALYPVSEFMVQSFMSAMLIIRRKQIYEKVPLRTDVAIAQANTGKL